jgi:hypothetical protein
MVDIVGLRCPICHSALTEYPTDKDVFNFLTQLSKQGILEEYLKVCRVYIDILDQGAPTAAVASKTVDVIRSEVCRVAGDEISKTTANLIIRMQEALRSQTPDPKSLEVLMKTLPELTLAIHELLKKQYVPQEKGKVAEKELYEELTNYFPEDEITRLGGASQTDIIIQPMHNGSVIGQPVIVESKSNGEWRREYLTQTRRYMKLKGSQYAILSLETMPKGVSLYHVEYVEEGAIFITERSSCKMVFGALKVILSSEHTLGRRADSLRNILADARIREALNCALSTSSYFESIRKKAIVIISNSKAISQDTDDAQRVIKTCITEMQRVIEESITSGELPPHPTPSITVNIEEVSKT